LFGVLTAIKFDYQTTIGTAKVNNVWTYWMLTAEFDPTELSITQTHPEFGLDIGLLLAQTTRPVA
jgi:hypothetical protein